MWLLLSSLEIMIGKWYVLLAAIYTDMALVFAIMCCYTKNPNQYYILNSQLCHYVIYIYIKFEMLYDHACSTFAVQEWAVTTRELTRERPR